MTYAKAAEGSAELAASCLRSGGVAILPTDTVYGFSAIVDVPSAPQPFKADGAIRAIKGRSESKPFIQLLARPEDINLYTADELPPSLLARWPGALTIIVRVREDAPLAERPPTAAFRCPGDEWIREVIARCGAPVYSTSVNRSGSPVLSSISAIRKEFERDVRLIVDDGDKAHALPSTIISVSGGTVSLLRQGAVAL